MHQQLRAIEHPLALKTASRSGQRSGVSGASVTFIGVASYPCRRACHVSSLPQPETAGLKVTSAARRVLSVELQQLLSQKGRRGHDAPVGEADLIGFPGDGGFRGTVANEVFGCLHP